jgi:hypothetical protein
VNTRTGAKDAEHEEPVDLDAARRESLVLTVDEAADAFAGEWLFMEVTERDERDEPLRGRILAHHPRREGIQPTMMTVVAEIKASQTPADVRGYYVTYGFRRFRTVAEWRDHMRQTAWGRR